VIERPKPPDNLWESLDAARSEALAQVRPPDSFTESEYSAKYDLPHATSKDQLHKLVKAGTLERVMQGRLVYFKLVQQEE